MYHPGPWEGDTAWEESPGVVLALAAPFICQHSMAWPGAGADPSLGSPSTESTPEADLWNTHSPEPEPLQVASCGLSSGCQPGGPSLVGR